jgi:AcrR family transcriptional regulator
MSSSPSAKRVRKTPEARRAEIVGKAAEIALAEGLEIITLRRVAEELGVRPGLIGHYFPVAEDLPSEAFGAAAGAELELLLPGDHGAESPPRRLAGFLAGTGGDAYDGMSRLWLNARHLSRYRPSLRERVTYQESLWRGRLTALIQDGVDAGDFRCADPADAAVWILVVLDGLGAHANTEDAGDAEADVDRRLRGGRPARMVVATAERELGLAAGTISSLISEL